MTGIKQSNFTQVTSVDEADNIPLFTGSENKRITYANMRDQLADEIAVRFIYPTTAQLQQSNLEADEDEPNYVRCEETEYRLYKITALAAGVDDIVLDNGMTATYQEEYSKSGFVLGAASSTNNALALFDGTTGAQLKTGAVLSTIGGNLASATSIAQVSYPRVDAANAVTMATPTTLKTDLNLPSNTAVSISNIESDISAIEGDITAIEGDLVDINADLAAKVQTVETFADLATTPAPTAGMIVYLKQHTSGGLGGGYFQDAAGTITNNGGTLINNTVTAGRHWKRINHTYVTPQMFGALANGIANDCNPFRQAIAASTAIYLPAGTYLIEPTAESGDFMLYLGTQNGQANRAGMHIWGDGYTSVIKLGDNVGRDRLLFGAGAADNMANMIFENIAFDMNGANNLQTSFADPLRYNSGFYFFCPCTNITFRNLYIYNVSGHQFVRIGADTGAAYGSNIKVIGCRLHNFGIGLTGNLQQDVSVFYIQASGILIENNWVQNSDFTFDLARGQTAFELHGDGHTIVKNNKFSYTQMPTLIVSSAKDNKNVIVSGNTYYQCNYLASLDPGEHDQSAVKIINNLYDSTKVASLIIPIGTSTEAAKDRENIHISGNTINTWGNTNQGTHLVVIEDTYVRAIVIENNDIGGLNGYLMYMAGTVRNTGVMSIVVKNNRLDSLGPTSGVFPNSPAFIYIAPSSGTINGLTIEGNDLYNSSVKNYSTNGAIKLSGNINYTYVRENNAHYNLDYPVVTSSITNAILKVIDNDYYKPIDYRTGPVTIGATSSVNLYSFSGFGNGDSALLEIKLWIGVGGTAFNTTQFVNVAYSSSGGGVTTASNFGTYSGDVSINFSGSTLRITNNNGSALSLYLNVAGLTTKNISWLV